LEGDADCGSSLRSSVKILNRSDMLEGTREAGEEQKRENKMALTYRASPAGGNPVPTEKEHVPEALREYGNRRHPS